MAKPGPKPSLDLWEFVPTTPDEMLLLEDHLIAAGVSPQRSARIPVRLYRLYSTGADGLTPVDRSAYRAELTKLAQPPWGWGRAATLVIRSKGACPIISVYKTLRESAGRADYSQLRAA